VEFEKKGISVKVTAFIFAAYNISAIVVSPFTDIIIAKIGRRQTLLLGLLSEGVGYLLLGFGASINHKVNYIGLAITARIISGFGGTCVMTTFYAIVLNFYTVN
jgi:MFS family permease